VTINEKGRLISQSYRRLRKKNRQINGKETHS
jgi:hypothetical protein